MYDADAPVIGVVTHGAVIVCVYGADPARSQFALTLKPLRVGILAAPRWVGSVLLIAPGDLASRSRDLFCATVS